MYLLHKNEKIVKSSHERINALNRQLMMEYSELESGITIYQKSKEELLMAIERRILKIMMRFERTGAEGNEGVKILDTLESNSVLGKYNTKVNDLLDKYAKYINALKKHGVTNPKKKMLHQIIGVNSRLDTIQAAILDVKLKYLEDYIQARNDMAAFYDESLKDIGQLETPKRSANSDHVFHQYTLKVNGGKRDELKAYLGGLGIPSMVYYPLPLYKQNAFKKFVRQGFQLRVTEELCDSVLSLPIHTEGSIKEMTFIVESIKAFYAISK